jgi:hypothetical protein
MANDIVISHSFLIYRNGKSVSNKTSKQLFLICGNIHGMENRTSKYEQERDIRTDIEA